MAFHTQSILALSAFGWFALSSAAQAYVATGSQIPDLEVTDSNGDVHSLSDFAGKTLVLEWTNHGCPYVKKHYNRAYNDGNMQSLQKAAADEDVVWLTVISSKPGSQGYVSGEDANALTDKRDAAPYAVILDPSGIAGRAFSAKTTPHMFVINAEQTLVYQGAIDDKRGTNPIEVFEANNYVRAALTAVKSGKPVETPETSPYGCNVKY